MATRIPASLAGVDFWIDETLASDYGRRTVVVELPGSDEVAYEDLGRSAALHDVKALLVGDDHDARATALLEVFSRPGPYPLSHPLYGSIQVILSPGSKARLSYQENRLRISQVSFALVEVTKSARVVTKPSTAAKLKMASSGLTTISAAQFVEKWSIKGSILAPTVAAIGVVTGALRDVKRKALGPLAITDALDDALDDLEASAEALAGLPADLASGLNAIIADISSLILTFAGPTQETYEGEAATAQLGAGVSAARDLSEVVVIEEPAYPGAPVDEDLAGNQEALELLLKAGGLAGLGTLVAELAAPSEAAADDLDAAAGDLADLLLDDGAVEVDLHRATRTLRDAVLARVEDARASLPESRVVTPAGPTSSILVAWQVHGDPTRAQEITTRNRLRHPSFITGPVEVLLDG